MNYRVEDAKTKRWLDRMWSLAAKLRGAKVGAPRTACIGSVSPPPHATTYFNALSLVQLLPHSLLVGISNELPFTFTTSYSLTSHENAWRAPPRPRKPKAFAVDLEAGSALEFLDSSWARSYLPVSWRSEEVRNTKPYHTRNRYLATKATYMRAPANLELTTLVRAEPRRRRCCAKAYDTVSLAASNSINAHIVMLKHRVVTSFCVENCHVVQKHAAWSHTASSVSARSKKKLSALPTCPPHSIENTHTFQSRHREEWREGRNL